MFSTESVIVPVTAKRKFELLASKNTIIQQAIEYMDSESLLCSDIIFNGMKYKLQDVVVMKAESTDSLVVGLIQTIMYKNSELYFLVYTYDTIRKSLKTLDIILEGKQSIN